jgi:protein TonB
VEGFVKVRIRVEASGQTSDVVVIDSQPPGVFDEVAINAAMPYRFEPALRRGVPIASTLEQRILFRLQR